MMMLLSRTVRFQEPWISVPLELKMDACSMQSSKLMVLLMEQGSLMSLQDYQLELVLHLVSHHLEIGDATQRRESHEQDEDDVAAFRRRRRLPRRVDAIK